MAPRELLCRADQGAALESRACNATFLSCNQFLCYRGVVFVRQTQGTLCDQACACWAGNGQSPKSPGTESRRSFGEMGKRCRVTAEGDGVR
ncbi:hypothetical protein SKAU_G00407140 [Synaphobranchus kaupii]|uniref:Uncharacterized protein n=1 Tax=Synaphobranchus kaupii TaxID=118154 RepID=A0A9Q1EAA6_SYNKA|nr:hypothetical protein SKAU_G00407140 [Synaphobranchus kaupii]